MAPDPQQPAALANNQLVSIKDAVGVVPYFDGHNIPLGQFLQGCDEARAMIDPLAEQNLARLIRGRLQGEARNCINGQTFNDITALKKYIREIYAPAKSVHQLLGELGNEYQKDKETVIAFANRMRDLGQKILEAKKVDANGDISAQEKTSLDNSIIECFKRGLKPEIEQRLTKEGIEDIIKEAVAIEKRLEARNNLRKEIQTEKHTQKRIHLCKICNVEDHETENCEQKTTDKVCKYCNKTGHTEERCFLKNRTTPECQLCNRAGHIANQCRLISKCQICNRIGHIAKNCNQAYSAICQLCNKIGHSASTCSRNFRPLESRSQLMCRICSKPGHSAYNCRTNPNTNNSRIKECSYCKNKGHEISECRKKRYNQQKYQNAGNETSPRITGATRRTPSPPHPSKQANNLLCELLPLD